MNCFKKICAVLLVLIMFLSIIPTTVFAITENEQMSEEFRSFLQDGKLVLNFAKPNFKDEQYAVRVCEFYADHFFVDGDPAYGLDLFDQNGKPAFSDDLSQVTAQLWKSGETGGFEQHTVDVVWNYDEDVNKKAQEIIQKLPVGESAESTFVLSDLEFVNYLAHLPSEYTWEISMLDYSGELKAITGNVNFAFDMDVRKGDGSTFHTEEGGITWLINGGAIYGLSFDMINMRSNYVIYVPENTPNDRESILKAAQKRVDDYIGKGKITITDNGETIEQYYQKEIANYDKKIADLEQEINELKSRLDAEPELSTTIWFKEFDLEDQKRYKEYTIEEYDRVQQFEHVKNAVGDYVFSVSANGKEEEYRFVVNKDDSKLAVPTYESVDAKTDVSASTDSSEVPLDTVIKVEKITHGEEHERICGTLEIKDGELFDIKLHSGSLDDYITELKNGKFKVRLPIKNEYKGKKLVVYYVDANGNKTKYNVTVKNGFAFFETDHFSIYTLTTESDDTQTPPNNTDDNNTSPNTGDNSNLPLWFAILIISSFGLVTTLCIGKSKN